MMVMKRVYYLMGGVKIRVQVQYIAHKINFTLMSHKLVRNISMNSCWELQLTVTA